MIKVGFMTTVKKGNINYLFFHSCVTINHFSNLFVSLTLIQTKLPLESSLKLTDLISKSYLTFRSKKSTLFNSNTSKTQEIPGFIFDFRSRQTVEFFHHFYELTLNNNLEKVYLQNAAKSAEIVLQYKLDEENACSNLKCE